MAAPSTTGSLVLGVPTPNPGNATTPECNNPASNGISTGAAVGVGVGAAVAAIALGTAGAWFFLLRHRRRGAKGSSVHRVPSMGGPPSPLAPKGEVEARAGGLHHYLLDGPGDSEIVDELTSLGHLLKDHVQISYHRAPLGRDCLSQIRSSLSGLGLDRETQSQIANLALNERTRHIAIQALLARVIFSALDIRPGSGPSLLPPSVAAFVKTVPLDRNGKLSSQDIAALSTWRRVSAYLLHENRVERSPLQVHANIDAQIRDLQAALDGFLGIFVQEDSRARASQSKGLERVVRACAKLGYKLFSHPCEWQYLFRAEAGSSVVVMLPGLERWSAPDGEMYKSGRLIVRPVTEDV